MKRYALCMLASILILQVNARFWNIVDLSKRRWNDGGIVHNQGLKCLTSDTLKIPRSWWDSNPRPKVYKTFALTRLSYMTDGANF
jgi:hypothetical protein